jgi:tRNA(Ile)-lysidine synthase
MKTILSSSISEKFFASLFFIEIMPLIEIKNTAVVIEKPDDYVFANGMISIKNRDAKNFSLMDDDNIVFIDAKNIEYPMILRLWKTGDYFYPLGMKKKKKISRFLIDKKLSLIEKEKVWVLEMNKKIVWVVGYRIDDRFKITDTTKEMIRLKFKNQNADA